MIQSFRVWLPTTALQPDKLEDRLSQAVGEWSRKWFAARPMRLRASEGEDGSSDRKPSPPDAWLALDEGLALGVAPDGPSRIAAAMLDLAADEKLSAAADDAVVERLAEGCLADLRARLFRLLGLPGDSPWQRDPHGGAPEAGTPIWSVGLDGHSPPIRLRADPELLVRIARQSVATPPDAFDLRPVREGLVRQPIRLSAFLGTCELTLSDVATLAAGDVVVLDSLVGDTLEMSIPPGDRSGRCLVEQDGEHLQLKIVRPFFE